MAGWSSSSSRRRSASSAVHITSPSPLVSCCSGTAGPSSPSPISIRGVSSNNGGYKRSPSAADAPVVTVSSKTTRLTIHGAGAQSPKPRDFARQRRALTPRRPSSASAPSSERIVLRALPATRRRSSSAGGPVSRPPSLGSVPELCESPGAEQFEELASQPMAAAPKSASRPFPQSKRASLRLLVRRKSLPNSIVASDGITSDIAAASLPTACVSRSSSKVLTFE